MIGMVALQRRLLVLMYSLWKTNSVYKEDFYLRRASGYQEDEASSSSSTRRVDQSKVNEKVDGATRLPSTQNEPLYELSRIIGIYLELTTVPFFISIQKIKSILFFQFSPKYLTNIGFRKFVCKFYLLWHFITC